MLALLAAGLVYGSVWIGPTAPVCRTGLPCRRAAVHVRLTFVRAGRTLSTTTDARGRYRIELPLGSWVVHASSGMRVSPQRVRVTRAPRRLTISIDTGIR
jgi:hypothetical protein